MHSAMKWSEAEPLTLRPIGVVRTPFLERVDAPRQPAARPDTEGRIELHDDPRFEHALEDLDGFRHLWVIFCFHSNQDWRPKVLPPRSDVRRGVFATRSPHRPNPIGLSAVELLGRDALVLRVRGVDMLDGTPVLDLKPYIPYTDALPSSGAGWLAEAAADPLPGWEVALEAQASEQLEYLSAAHGIALAAALRERLALGPQPHPYRRIRRCGDDLVIAVSEWRARFRVEGRRIVVTAIASGYRPAQLATGAEPELAAHRAFVARFGWQI